MAVDREMVKWHALLARGGPRFARCDKCQRLLWKLGESGEMHEIISKARTKKGGAARSASYKVELTSILCRQCHAHYHDQDSSDSEKDVFARKNFAIFGRERVEAAYARLQALLAPKGLTIPYQLPEPEDEEAPPHQPRSPP